MRQLESSEPGVSCMYLNVDLQKSDELRKSLLKRSPMTLMLVAETVPAKSRTEMS